RASGDVPCVRHRCPPPCADHRDYPHPDRADRLARRKEAGMRMLLRVAIGSAIALTLGLAALITLYRFVPPSLTPLMAIRSFEGEGTTQRWMPYSEISPQLRRAVIASEDARFCQHHGFDWSAIKAAW